MINNSIVVVFKEKTNYDSYYYFIRRVIISEIIYRYRSITTAWEVSSVCDKILAYLKIK